MKTITIIFMGLIAHVNQPWSLDNTAVVVLAHGHKAELRIPKQAVIAPDPWLQQFARTDPFAGEIYAIDLQGKSVRVKNTRGLFSRRSPQLIASVPSLKTLAPKCKLRKEVRERTTAPDVVSYIDYRGGRVAPDSYFAEKLVIDGVPSWKDGRCVACRVRYEADLKSDEAALLFTLADGTKPVVRIAGDSSLEVHNIPPRNEPIDPTVSHFGAHYSIFENCQGPPAHRHGVCDEPQNCEALPETDDEEAILAAAIPTPNGDCTNSNYP